MKLIVLALTLSFPLLAQTASAAALTVESNFEGASVSAVEIDNATRSISFMPGGDPARGWPCWWNFRIRGARPGETLTLRLRAVSAPIPQSVYAWLKDKPLSLDWASPSCAAWSSDGETWQRTEPGLREGEWMIYRLKATMDPLLVAWGPPYTPSRAGEFARACAKKYPAVVKAESLCQSRDGRSVTLLRITEGPRPVPERGAIWVQARQHAWESGSSWIAQGFAEWLLADSPEATWLRQNHEIFVVPVMDVDHAATGQGGKEAIPQDQNRDWTDRPHWPEVAAAQAAIGALIKADRLRAFLDLHNPGPNDRAVHFHTPPDEATKPGQRAAIDKFNLSAKTHLSKVMPVQEAVVKSGANYNANWMQMSHCWVAARAPESTLALCIETPWNLEQSSQEGYRKMGAAIGLTTYMQRHEADAPSTKSVSYLSPNGSDTNDGKTPATAWKTLAKAQASVFPGMTLLLERGGVWREMLDLRFKPIISIGNYGSGPPPEVNGADVISPGSFIPSTHAEAAGVCYEYAWTRGHGHEAGFDQVMLWENDVRLYRRTSVALVAASPGSYYSPGEEAATSIVYMHPYGTTDPRSDGKTYEITKRGAGIDNYDPASAGSSISGVHLNRAWSHTGPMSGPVRGGMARNLLIGGGGIHHIVTSVDTSEDIVIYDVAKNYGTGFFPYVNYLANGRGYTHTARRIFSHGDSDADAASRSWNEGFYSHGFGSGYDKVTYEQCLQTNARKGFSSSNPEIAVLGCYGRNLDTAVYTGSNQTITVKYLIAAGCGTGIDDSGPVNHTVKTRLIEHCVIEADGALATGIRALARNGSLILRNCVIIGNFSRFLESSVVTAMNITIERCIVVYTGTGPLLTYPNIGSGTYTGTNNIFFNLAATAEANRFYFNKGTGQVNGLTAWKALGFDTNSLAIGPFNGKSEVTSLFVEDPRKNGNYTLRTDTGLVFGDGSTIMTAGPQEHWDWNLRKAVAGTVTRLPVLPTTFAEMKSYVDNPATWNFYPQ